MERRARKDHFSELPQPLPSKTVLHTVDDNFLSGLEAYIDALGKHISNIQDDEIRITREFSDALEDMNKSISSKEHEKRQKKEDHIRNLFLGQLSAVRQKRKQYREMLYDALQERRKLWDSMQIQKDDEDILRRKMNKLGALPDTQKMKQQRKIAVRDLFSALFLLGQILLIIGFALATKYGESPSTLDTVGTPNRSENIFTFYTHIALMIFVGLGLLNSFMKKYGLSGIGYTMMLTAFALQWSILIHGFFEQAGEAWADGPNKSWEKIQIGFDDLIWGLYGATTLLVALSTVLGRTTPLQQIVVAAWLIPFWGLNYFIDYWLLKVKWDLGGSMLIFVFGGSFGLSLSLCSTRPQDHRKDHVDNTSRYDSDLFAFLGTTILFVLWPSFNAAFAPDGTQYRVIINTVLALASSVVFAFLFSRAMRGGKFAMYDLSRATLAGAMAIGSCTSFLIAPGGALTLGAVAGGAAAIATTHLQTLLARYVKLDDSFGAVSTFLLPGIIGGLAGVVSTAVSADKSTIFGQDYAHLFPDNGKNAAGYHLVVLAVSCAIGLLSAIPLGLLLRWTRLGNASHFYTDETEWDVPTDFEAHVDDIDDDKNVELKEF